MGKRVQTVLVESFAAQDFVDKLGSKIDEYEAAGWQIEVHYSTNYDIEAVYTNQYSALLVMRKGN